MAEVVDDLLSPVGEHRGEGFELWGTFPHRSLLSEEQSPLSPFAVWEPAIPSLGICPYRIP